jgi:hypothetical protein
MEWDEVTHFTGGLLMLRGQIGQWVWTNSFYPPAFDLVTAVFYFFGGVSVFTARLVSVTFSVLSLFVIFELAHKMYDAKVALLSVGLFSVMPGIVWLSRMAMIETMLIFVFSLSMYFLFSWLHSGKEIDRMISVAALAVGVAVKYQMLVVVPIIMLFGMYFWKRDFLKAEAKKYLHFPRIALVVVVLAVVAVVAYLLFVSGLKNTLLYAIQIGTADKALYSVRYPVPIFYFIEMAWSSEFMHPVSLLLYLIALAGISLFAIRRNFEDRFLLLWFAVSLLVFTVIPNREWRYVTIVFPVLSIASSSLLFSVFRKIQNVAQAAKRITVTKWAARLTAAALIVLTVVGVLYSSVDAYTWVKGDQIQVPIHEATEFAAENLGRDQSLLIVCPLNRFNQFMVWFYLNAKAPNPNGNQTLQYPQLAVDAYTPEFNSKEIIDICQTHKVKYALLYEYGGYMYFNSTLTTQQVLDDLGATRRFSPKATFGSEPHRVFILEFG